MRWLAVIINPLWLGFRLLAAVMLYLERRSQSVISEVVSPNLAFTMLVLGFIGIPCLLNATYIGARLNAKS